MKDMKWDVLDSEYIVRRPWLTARRDKVRLPDGRVNDEYYVLEYPDWVNIIAITDDDRFVLVRQYRHGLGRTSFELRVPKSRHAASCSRKPDMPEANGTSSCSSPPMPRHRTTSPTVS